jgi:Holliday junction DNA helicase RuvA
MIAFIHGKIAEKFAGSVVIDVAGVGYEVTVPSGDYDAAVLGEEMKFYTYHYIREQSEELFGFSSLAAKRLFKMLTAVQGVGPKAALAILSLGETETVRNALANADAGFVAGAAGVGKKTAERVILELSEKVGAPSVYGRSGDERPIDVKDEALEALMALGYSLSDASDALKNIDAGLPTGERVTLALKRNK